MTHDWTPEDIAKAIQAARVYPARGEERDQVAQEFAEVLTT